MQRAAWTVALGLWLATVARAQAPLPLELRWEAPPECGTSADVQAELERIARARPGHALLPLRAQAHVVREPAGGYSVQLSTEREREVGERRLAAPDCATLVRSLTLVLALAFGKDVEVATEPVAAGADAAVPPASAPQDGAVPSVSSTAVPAAPRAERTAERTPAAGPEPATEDSPSPDLRFALLLGAGLQLALMPELAGQGLIGVELAGQRWSIALRAAVWPAASTRVAPELAARFDGLGGALEGCAVLGPDTLPLALCGVAQAAALRGRSEGAFEDGSDVAAWLALGPLVSATWPGSGVLRVRLAAALPFSLARPRFVVAGLGPVHRVPLLSPELGLRLVLAP